MKIGFPLKLCVILLMSFSLMLVVHPSKIYSQAGTGEAKIQNWIPTGYETYTLFLFCSHEWEKPSKQKDVKEIYIDFLNFSDSIGKRNLAVWFWKHKKKFQIDVSKGQDYCTALDLDPNQSPYVLVTSFYPILKKDLIELESKTQSILNDLISLKNHNVSLSKYRKRLEKTTNRKRLYEFEQIKDQLLNLQFEKEKIIAVPIFGVEVVRTLKEELMKEEEPITRYLSVLKESFTRLDKHELYIISFGNISTKYIVNALNKLEQNIRRGRDFGKGITYEKLKQIVKSFIEENKELLKFLVKEIIVPLLQGRKK